MPGFGNDLGARLSVRACRSPRASGAARDSIRHAGFERVDGGFEPDLSAVLRPGQAPRVGELIEYDRAPAVREARRPTVVHAAPHNRVLDEIEGQHVVPSNADDPLGDDLVGEKQNLLQRRWRYAAREFMLDDASRCEWTTRVGLKLINDSCAVTHKEQWIATRSADKQPVHVWERIGPRPYRRGARGHGRGNGPHLRCRHDEPGPPGMSEYPRRFRLEVESRPESVTLVRAALSAIAESLELDDVLADDLKTAVSEACNNVVIHAYPGADGPMALSIVASDDSLGVLVEDCGGGIKHVAVSEERMGVGIALISALADAAHFRSRPGGGTSVESVIPLPTASAEPRRCRLSS